MVVLQFLSPSDLLTLCSAKSVQGRSSTACHRIMEWVGSDAKAHLIPTPLAKGRDREKSSEE